MRGDIARPDIGRGTRARAIRRGMSKNVHHGKNRGRARKEERSNRQSFIRLIAVADRFLPFAVQRSAFASHLSPLTSYLLLLTFRRHADTPFRGHASPVLVLDLAGPGMGPAKHAKARERGMRGDIAR